jgi:adenylate cyclase class IV
MVQEIEIKSLLTKEKYEELQQNLPLKFKKINEDTITTTRFKPKDIRIRYSEKIAEMVIKDGDPTTISRKETTINLKSKEDCHKMIEILRELGYKQDPEWTKKKEEFLLKKNNQEYTLSLQNILNFAYILEAEIITEEHNEEHIKVLKQILKELDCEVIEPKEFKEKIEEYIKKNSV